MTDDNKGDQNKVIFLGDVGVGKTSLVNISTGKDYKEEYESSTSLTFFEKKVSYKDKTYTFNLWDTIGQEKYRALTKIFYSFSKIVIFVYDITNRNSFDSLEYWINSVNTELGENKYIKAIIGNKSDLFMDETIKQDEAEEYAISKGCKFKICSAKRTPLDFMKFLDELCIEDIERNEIEENNRDNFSLERRVKRGNKKCVC